ncbi:MAG TPA: hypothetical protein VKV96_00670 [Roseiarcus sp.]|jgi:hypothetical protein|nr:hypothetical protein [Roseiarcus sp.]
MNAPSRRRVRPAPSQPDLFDAPQALPEGFRYAADLLSEAEEQALARELAALPSSLSNFTAMKPIAA